MEKTQREYYLNEQMSAIQKELGGKESPETEARELENRLKEKKLPPEGHEKISKVGRK